MKNFTALIIAIALSFISQAVFAQCEVKEDPITGERVVTHEAWDAAWKKVNGEVTLRYTFSQTGLTNDAIPAGSKLYIKLKTDEVVELMVEKDLVPTARNSQNYVYTSFSHTFSIDQNTLSMLADGNRFS